MKLPGTAATAYHQYIGCYGDGSNNRSLGLCIKCDVKDGYNNINTIQSCSKSCAENNYTYAGVQVTKSQLM